MVTTPKRDFAGSNLRWVPKITGWPGRSINVLHCGGLSMVPLRLKDLRNYLLREGNFSLVPGFCFVAI